MRSFPESHGQPHWPAAHLAAAHDWLCAARRLWPDVSDVWTMRRHWARELPETAATLNRGTYQFSLQTAVTNGAGETHHEPDVRRASHIDPDAQLEIMGAW